MELTLAPAKPPSMPDDQAGRKKSGEYQASATRCFWKKNVAWRNPATTGKVVPKTKPDDAALCTPFPLLLRTIRPGYRAILMMMEANLDLAAWPG